MSGNEGAEKRMTTTQEFDLLVSEHIDGKPKAHSTQRLSEMIRRDPKLRREFTDQIMMHNLLSQYWEGKPRRRVVLDKAVKTPVPQPPPPRTSIMDRLFRPFRRSLS